MESNENKLKNLKRKLLEKKNKIEAMLFELREINQSFFQLKELILKSDKVNEIKNNTDFVKSFEKLSENKKFSIVSQDKLSRRLHYPAYGRGRVYYTNARTYE